MEMFRLADFQSFVWFEVLVGLLALSAFVYAGSDQQYCFVPAPSDEDTDPCPPWFIPQEIAQLLNVYVVLQLKGSYVTQKHVTHHFIFDTV